MTEPIRSESGSAFVRMAHKVVVADGAMRVFICLAAGLVGALALPPLGIFPALVVPMSAAVWLIDGGGASRLERIRSSALAGWLLGLGYFVGGFYWLGAAFLVEPDRFAWLMPLGVLGLPAVLACFTAAGFALAALLWKPGATRIFTLAWALGLSEIARGVLFTGFPWNVFGMAFGQFPLLAQTASIYGLYGLTGVVITICAAPATLADMPEKGRSRYLATLASGAVFVGLVAFGAARLSAARVEVFPQVKLRLLQPNLQQDAAFRPAASAEILRRYLELSDRSTSPATAGLSTVTHLVWPESPFPFVLGREPQALSMIGAALAGRTVLLTGAVRLDGDKLADARAFNSLQVVDSRGQIVASGDKVHLVPFGEYLPASGLLRTIGLRQFVAFPGGFEPGDERRAMSAPGLPPFQPLICYEAVFPGDVMPRRQDAGRLRPEFMLNVTNDGWYGMTSGPYQHFAQARLRAIEEGMALVRSANTGISAIVDPYGRVTQELPLGVAGVLDGQLPRPINPPIFARYPWGSVACLFGLLLFASLVGWRRV